MTAKKPATVAQDAAFGHEPPNALTKREYFAGLAMQGLCADVSVRDIDQISTLAVDAADALIAALNKGKS
jgi:hypothetical protein